MSSLSQFYGGVNDTPPIGISGTLATSAPMFSATTNYSVSKPPGYVTASSSSTSVYVDVCNITGQEGLIDVITARCAHTSTNSGINLLVTIDGVEFNVTPSSSVYAYAEWVLVGVYYGTNTAGGYVAGGHPLVFKNSLRVQIKLSAYAQGGTAYGFVRYWRTK